MAIRRQIWKALPLFMVLFCTGFRWYMFKKVIIKGAAITAAGIFRTALIILIWRIRIYPTSYKKLGRFMQIIVEFLLAMFIVEYLQANFWLPIEEVINNLCRQFFDSAEKLPEELTADLGDIKGIDYGEWTSCVVTYFLSIFFCASAMHGTKMVDFRETKYGPEPFINALIHVYQNFLLMIRRRKAIPKPTAKRSSSIKQRYNQRRKDDYC